MFFFFLLFFCITENDIENPDGLLGENQSQSNPVNDSPLSETATIEEQSPASVDDNNIAEDSTTTTTTQIKSQVPRIDAINAKQLNSSIDSCRRHLNQRQLPAIDVERNIPASFIHDINNAAVTER